MITHNTYLERQYNLHDVRFTLATNCKNILDFFEAYCDGYIEKLISSTKVNFELRLEIKSDLDSKFEQLSRISKPLFIDSEVERAMFVAGSSSNHFTLYLKRSNYENNKYIVRLIRVLVHSHLLVKGYIPLHSSCVVNLNKGFCFLGQKEAGKTTSALSALAFDSNRSFLTNDTIYIKESQNGEIKLYGMPVALGIRRGTINHINALKNLCIEQHGENWVNFYTKERLMLTPQRITHLLNSRIKNSADLSGMFFPQFEEYATKLTCIRLVPEKLFALLFENYLSFEPFKYSKYLLEYLPNDLAFYKKRDIRVLKRLSRKINAYIIKQSGITGDVISKFELIEKEMLV